MQRTAPHVYHPDSGPPPVRLRPYQPPLPLEELAEDESSETGAERLSDKED